MTLGLWWVSERNWKIPRRHFGVYTIIKCGPDDNVDADRSSRNCQFLSLTQSPSVRTFVLEVQVSELITMRVQSKSKESFDLWPSSIIFLSAQKVWKETTAQEDKLQCLLRPDWSIFLVSLNRNNVLRNPSFTQLTLHRQLSVSLSSLSAVHFVVRCLKCPILQNPLHLIPAGLLTEEGILAMHHHDNECVARGNGAAFVVNAKLPVVSATLVTTSRGVCITIFYEGAEVAIIAMLSLSWFFSK